MSKTAIYYFSATGNSLAVARHLAKLLDVGDPVSVPGSLVMEDPYIDARKANAVGFVFPVHRATLPEMLHGFIQSMPIDPNCYYFAVSTYSLFGSNEFWDIDELLVSKGAALNYAAGVHMMGNVGLLEPSDTTIEKRLKHMMRQVDEIATAVAYHQESFFPRSNKLLGWAVRTYTDLRRRSIVFRIDKRCKGCGICVQVCPAQNIKLPEKGSGATAPIRSDKCEACLACIHWCPAAAISTSRRGHISYHNPTVSPEELHTTSSELNTAPDSQSPQSANVDILDGQTSGSTVELDAELAAALRDDLLAPEDVGDQLGRVSTDDQDIPSLYGQSDLTVSGEPSMSDDDIVKALSDLET